MNRRIIHQWKDWLLEYVGDGSYELIHKYNLSVQTIMAKNAMDAENQCRQIMTNLKKEEP